MPRPNTPPLNPAGGSPRETAFTVNAVLRGKINSVGRVTLTEDTTTTTLTDANIGLESEIFFTPRTADAQAEGSPWYAITTRGEAVLTHANDPSTDRIFGYLIIG